MQGSKSKVESTVDKFDQHYRRASLAFAAESLEAKYNSLQNESARIDRSNDLMMYTTCKADFVVDQSAQTQAFNSWSGDGTSGGLRSYPRGIDTTDWVPRVGDPSPIYIDWYDWWWKPYRYEYVWPDMTQFEIKKILEEIRDKLNGVPNKLPNDIVSSNWPPSNVGVLKNGDLIIEVALAGFKKADIDVEMGADDKLIVTATAKAQNSEKSLMQNGIKCSDGKIEFFVDPEKFDQSSIDVTFEDAILSIVVKRSAASTHRKIEIR